MLQERTEMLGGRVYKVPRKIKAFAYVFKIGIRDDGLWEAFKIITNRWGQADRIRKKDGRWTI